jgi:nucleoside phosphorylase
MQVDYLIVTPMHEEFDALCAYFPNATSLDKVHEDPHTYKTCLFPTSRTDHAEYIIALTTLIGKGQSNAAAEVQQMLARWSPRNVLLVGIAAGNAAGGVNVGDILLPMEVIGELGGKKTDSGTARDSVSVLISQSLYDSACQLITTAWRDSIRVAPPSTTMFRCHNDGIVISVPEVLADSESMARLHGKYRHFLGVETEAAGTWKALRLSVENIPAFFMIRAVSDAGDPSKVDVWHAHAASAAGAFCRALLLRGPTPATVSGGLESVDPPFEQIPYSGAPKHCCSFPRVRARSVSPLPFTQRAAHELERLRRVCLSKCRIHKMLPVPIFLFLIIFLSGMYRLWAACALTSVDTLTVSCCLIPALILWKQREGYRAVVEQAEATGFAFCRLLCTTAARDDDVRFFSEQILYFETRPRIL